MISLLALFLTASSPAQATDFKGAPLMHIISCKATQNVHETPTEIGIYLGGMNLDGEPRPGLITAKMAHPHAPNMVMSLAYIIEFSAEGSKATGNGGENGPTIVYDKDEFQKNMFERGRKFDATLTLSSEKLVYKCDAVNKYKR